jgi:hypothetical protein
VYQLCLLNIFVYFDLAHLLGLENGNLKKNALSKI